MVDSSTSVEACHARPLHVDPRVLAAGFGAHPVSLRHDLAGSRGFTVTDIVALAHRPGPAAMEATPAHMPLLTPNGVPRIGGDLAELARGIGSADARLGLLGLQGIDPYRGVLRAVLGQVFGSVGTPEGPRQRDETSLFLAAPGATVPVHFDGHHNVLLQLAGTKELTIGAFGDPDDQARALETGCRSRKRMGHLVPPAIARFHLGPGDGLYIPPHTFHWVEGGTEVSAALSCSFSTAFTNRADGVYACNAQLRRLGLRPRPPGRSVPRDRLKTTALSAARRVRPVRR